MHLPSIPGNRRSQVLAARWGQGRAITLEIAIDALDIAAVLPFWQAVLGYDVVERPIAEGHKEVIVGDPVGQGPQSGSSNWTPRARNATGSTST